MIDLEIESVLRELEKVLDKKFVTGNEPINISFAQGHTGIAIFYSYYFLLTENNQFRDKARLLIDRVVDHISSHDCSFTFCDGVAGVAWAIQHLNELGILNNKFDLSDYDRYLFQVGKIQLEHGNCDYLHGGLGCGIYLLNRENTDRKLTKLLQVLGEASLVNSAGRFWINSFNSNGIGETKVNFGLAHGLPSVIYFLTNLVKLDVCKDQALRYLKETIDFVITNSSPQEFVGSYFPNDYLVGRPGPKETSRLAWCYGDLGILTSFMQAADQLNDDALKRATYDWALRNIGRTEKKHTGINDGGICHGIAGVALIIACFYEHYQDERFKARSDRWVAELLSYIKWSGGIARFSEFERRNKSYKVANGFLTGSVGAGLVLISFLSNWKMAGWRKYLLLP